MQYSFWPLDADTVPKYTEGNLPGECMEIHLKNKDGAMRSDLACPINNNNSGRGTFHKHYNVNNHIQYVAGILLLPV